MSRPFVILSDEMIEAARRLEDEVRVARTRISPVDTLGGILGEFAFAEWFTGSWRNHEVGANRGRADFRGIVEVKTSVFPFRENLNLVIRADYGEKYKPLYVQVIIAVPDARDKRITAGLNAILCGYATHAQATSRPAAPMRMGAGVTPYPAFTTPIRELSDMVSFAAAYAAARRS